MKKTDENWLLFNTKSHRIEKLILDLQFKSWQYGKWALMIAELGGGVYTIVQLTPQFVLHPMRTVCTILLELMHNTSHFRSEPLRSKDQVAVWPRFLQHLLSYVMYLLKVHSKQILLLFSFRETESCCQRDISETWSPRIRVVNSWAITIMLRLARWVPHYTAIRSTYEHSESDKCSTVFS